MKRLLSILLLSIFFAVPATAAVPVEVARENRDGRQLIVKTFELSPQDEPESLIEAPFEEDGFTYELLDIVKKETPLEETKTVTESVSLETAENDLSDILQQLSASIEYEQNGFAGKLALDHTSICTEAAGYSTKTYTVTDTQTIGGLDRNDLSYVPKSTVKNGVTLSLQSISWAAQDAVLSGDNLVTSSCYTATAYYSGNYSKRVADGYVTTARYSGEVKRSGVLKVVYTLTYLGSPIPLPELEAEIVPEPEPVAGLPWYATPVALACFSFVFLLAVAATLSYFRSNALVYAREGDEYILTGRLRVNPAKPKIDIRRFRHSREGAAVLLKRQLAARLFGRSVATIGNGHTMRCVVDRSDGDFWYLFSYPDPEAPEEIIIMEESEK